MESGRAVWVKPSDEAFTYEGRIDFTKQEAPVFVYAGSFIRFRMKGRTCYMAAENSRSYYGNALGVLVDGEYRGKFVLHDTFRTVGETGEFFLERFEGAVKESLKAELEKKNGDIRFYDLSAFLDGNEHEVTIFKRMDACHYFTFHGLVAEEGSFGTALTPLPQRRIEVFGDSVSCGEVSEAVGRSGQSDPEGHNGIYSNSFYSYSWILARRLGARVHITSQGGMALLDGEGYFNDPDLRGMLSSFDKIQNNPSLGELVRWDMNKYVPHVVILAIGQNDHNPENYMVEDYNGEKARNWRNKYRQLIQELRGYYPRAEIILSTTILGHDVEWDRAIDQVCQELADPKVHHFLYSQNGCGTCGHIRRNEAEKMAEEMEAFILALGEDIWKDGNE